MVLAQYFQEEKGNLYLEYVSISWRAKCCLLHKKIIYYNQLDTREPVGPLEMIRYLGLKVYLWCEQVSHSKVISSGNGKNIFLNPCIASIPASMYILYMDLLNKHQGDWEKRFTNQKSHSSFPFDYWELPLYKCPLVGICMYVCMLSHFSYVRLFCNLMDCSLPGSSVHGDSPGKILEWVVMLSFRGSSPHGDQTCVSMSSVLTGSFFITSATWEASVFA